MRNLSKSLLAIIASSWLLAVPFAAAQDADENFEMPADEFLNYEDDIADTGPAAVRDLPPGVDLLRSEAGDYQAPFEHQVLCSGGVCEEIVINTVSGQIVFANDAWQAGAIETGYGLEVVIAQDD